MRASMVGVIISGDIGRGPRRERGDLGGNQTKYGIPGVTSELGAIMAILGRLVFLLTNVLYVVNGSIREYLNKDKEK